MSINYNKGADVFSPYQKKSTIGVVVSYRGVRSATGEVSCDLQRSTVSNFDIHSYARTITAPSEEELEETLNGAKRDAYRRIIADLDVRMKEAQRLRKEMEKLMNEIPVPGQKSMF